MSSLTVLETNLFSICKDLKTDKVAPRLKAFNKLDGILDGRLDELHVLFKDSTLNWTYLLSSAHEGLLQHAEKLRGTQIEHEHDPKILNYMKVVTKIVNSANEKNQEVPFKVLLEMIMSIIENSSHTKFFGEHYLQILQRNILQSKSNLIEIKVNEWSRILSYCFKLLECRSHSINSSLIGNCTASVIEIGTNNSHLGVDLYQYLPLLVNLLEGCPNGKFQNEIIKICYLCCKNLVTNYRFALCSFTESIMGSVFKAYQNGKNLDEKSKTIFFKLMDLSIIIHTPNLSEDREKLQQVVDEKEWHSHLRNLTFVMENELSLATTSKGNLPPVNPFLVQFAARLSYLVYWDNRIWEINSNTEGAQSSKRLKSVNKLQTVIDQVSKGNTKSFNWKWLIVLSELVSNYPKALINDDFLPLLTILSQFQPTIEQSIQVYALAKCSLVLLQHEVNFLKTCNDHVRGYNEGLWNSIAEGAFRLSTSNSKLCIDYHILLQVLIKYQKYPSSNFILDIINTFLSNSTKRTDVTLSTLVTILESFNLDSLENSDLCTKILKYLFEKPNVYHLKSVIMNVEKINPSILGQLTVICCLSKTDVFNFNQKSDVMNHFVHWKQNELKSYKTEMDEITHLILQKYLEKLVIEDDDFLVGENPEAPKSMPVDLKCIIDEEILKSLSTVMPFNENPPPEDADSDAISFYLQSVLENAELNAHILNQFLLYDALNRDKFDSSPIRKELNFRLQLLDMLFSKIDHVSLDLKDTLQILKFVKGLVNTNFHPVISEMIRTFDLKNMLSWVQNQINSDFNPVFTKSFISLENFQEAKLERKVKYQALEALALYLHYEGTNTEFVVDQLKIVTFEILDNVELHSVLNLIKLLGQQKEVHKDVSSWIILEMQEICCRHHQSPYVSNCIVEIMPDVMKLSKGDEDLSKDVITMVQSFTRKCVQKRYSPKFSVALLHQLKSFHKTFFHLVNDTSLKVKAVYESIVKLLYTPFLEIKLAAIKCLSFIVQIQMGNDFDGFDSLPSSRSFKLALYGSVLLKDLADSDEEIDGNINTVCSSMQLFSSAFSCNYILRKKIILDMAKLCINKDIKEPDARRVFGKIMKFLKSDFDNFMDSGNILSLICLYLKEDLQLHKFPYYFTTTKSAEEFCQKYYSIVILAILRTNVSLFEEFSKKFQKPPKDAIQTIFPDCSAYLLPVLSQCDDVEYTSNAEAMYKIIQKYFTKNEMEGLTIRFYKEIIEKLLTNVYDRDFFESLCMFRFDIQKEVDMVDLKGLNQCLEYLKKEVIGVSPSSFLTTLCQRKPSAIENLLMNSKTRVQVATIPEQQLQYLLQYCVLVNQLFEFLATAVPTGKLDIKGFLIRDVVHFLCNLIVNESETTSNKISGIACNFLEKFLLEILPFCAEYLKPFLNYVVFILISICKKNPSNSPIVKMCMKVLNLLIIDQQEVLRDEIAKLDNFPVHEMFNELKNVHHTVKYKGKQFSLVEEVEHFLSMDKRKIEGLISLRENLSSKKDELLQIYNDLLKTNCFSEDGERSLLHKLVQVLIAHVNGVDEQKAIEAVKCLGEIGAYDLATMVFQSDASSTTIYHGILTRDQSVEIAVKTALERLNLLLVDFDPRVFQAVSAACYHLLSKDVGKRNSTIYLKPFIIKPAEADECVFKKPSNDSKELNLVEIFISEEYSKYSCFIQRTCCELFTFLGDEMLQCVAAVQVSFAEKMIPMLIQVLLSYQSPTLNQKIVEAVNHFFQECSERQLSKNPEIRTSMFMNKIAIKVFLNVAECVRVYRQNDAKSTFPVNLSYLKIAKAARYCEDHFTAVIYCEIYARNRLDDDLLSFETSLRDKNLCDIMNDAYLSIGLRDGQDVFVKLLKSRNSLETTSNRSLVELDVAYHSNKDCSAMYQAALMKNGMYALAKSIPSEDPQYECLWRLGDWSALIEADSETVDHSKALDLQVDYEKYHYTALKCLSNLDELGTTTAINRGRKIIVQMLKRASLQCTKNLYKFLNMSQRIQQIEDYYQIQFRKDMQDVKLDALKKWKSQDRIPYSDFQHVESILAQRNSIFSTARLTHARKFIPEAKQSNTLFIIKEAISSGQNNVAISNIAIMRSQEKLIPDLEAELLIEYSRMSWNLKDTNLAKQLLLQIIHDKELKDSLIKSKAYRLQGEYLAQNHAESIDKIHENYFLKSLACYEEFLRKNGKNDLLQSEIASQCGDEDEITVRMRKEMLIYETIAKYADREYIQINTYMESIAFKNKKKSVQKVNSELTAVRKSTLTQNDKMPYLIKIKTMDIDILEIKNTEDQREFYAARAMQFYIYNSIINKSASVLSIFRLVSLWLSNYKSSKILRLVDKKLHLIPSHKFLLLLPQLTARLSETKDLLSDLLERCTIDHPHHMISLIMALVKSNVDNPNKDAESEPRILGAQNLLDRLAKVPKLTEAIQQYHKMSDALIGLANRQSIEEIQENDPILMIKNYDAIQCPTVTLEMALDRNYKDRIVTVIKWYKHVGYVGGVNAPKKVRCLCSDGKERSQLIKGKDDLRQDAVMQQVFGIVNKTLMDHPDTKKRHLTMRTYKVVPLTRRCGIIEFCDDAISLGNYLIGDNRRCLGAHATKRPADWSARKCRSQVESVDKESQKVKLQMFEKICLQFKPVFHHFFYENFQRPGVWFERRLAYLSSVAVSSMVGYILGIGDRHVQNILIDTNTAEVIHIDFGIAFEQGKILPHPETIPFRLTRDMISPMGMSGVNGVFRKTCEKTLEVLRENKTILRTILEVLLYDPLYVWTMSSEKVRRHQFNEENVECSVGADYEEVEERNVTATRVLSRVEAKLEGLEVERMSYSSVEGQVDNLIQTAMNPALLSRLFAGWQAYL